MKPTIAQLVERKTVEFCGYLQVAGSIPAGRSFFINKIHQLIHILSPKTIKYMQSSPSSHLPPYYPAIVQYISTRHSILYNIMHNKQSIKEALFQIKPTSYEVTLNTKYNIEKGHPLFEDISLIVYYINQKDIRARKKYHQSFDIRYFSTLEFLLAKTDVKDEKCMICLDEYQIKKDFIKQNQHDDDYDILMLGCTHKYHRACLVHMIGQKKWAKCPICSTIFGKMEGDQPNGKMKHHIDKNLTCQGYPKGTGTIVITYNLQSGKRKGVPFQGTSRLAYLPNTPEGKEVLLLLQEAFNRRLTFTVGRSVTTGMDNQTVWNGIHHKTCVSGGAANFGYPDETYLKRVKEELACKGIIAKK